MKALSILILLLFALPDRASSETADPTTNTLACPTINMFWTDVSCNGLSNGSAEAVLSGGSGNFVYDWSTGDTTAAVIGLPPGTHFVNVTDTTESCTVFGLVVIEEPEPLIVAPSSTPVGCFGGSDGTASANVSGGTAPYVFVWSNGLLDETITGLIATTYSVIVSDTNGCGSFGSTTVGVSNSFLVSFDSIQHVSCANYADGSVQAVATGGSGIYEYLWNTGDSVSAIDSLVTGIYSILVSDTNGCVTSDSLLIDEPLALSVTVTSEDATSCFNTCDGTAIVQASGGTMPYNYLWDANTGSQTGPVASYLCPDTFIVSVTDGHGCGVLTSAIITSPDTIFVVDSLAHALCFGSLDGAVYTEVYNSSGPWQYQWADTNYVLSQTGYDLLNVPAGTYFVEITDSLGCIVLDTFLVQQPEPLVTTFQPTDVTCSGFSDGNIVQTVSGGTAPYSFLWADGDTLQNRTSVPTDTYFVLITDTQGCHLQDSVEVLEPDPLVTTALINDVSCNQESNGSISLFSTGGNGSYQYLWNTGSQDDEISGSEGGLFSVVVTDALGCAFEDQYEILVTNEACINVPSAFTPNSDGLNDTWVLRNIELYPGNSVKIMNRWGQVVHESNEYNRSWNGRYNGEDLPAGTYYYIVDLNDGKEPLTGPVTLVR